MVGEAGVASKGGQRHAPHHRSLRTGFRLRHGVTWDNFPNFPEEARHLENEDRESNDFKGCLFSLKKWDNAQRTMAPRLAYCVPTLTLCSQVTAE